MAPTTRQTARTKHKLGTTNVGEEVLDLVIPYIQDVDDRNSVSLVSRKLCEIVGIMCKRLTVHVHYYPNPASLSQRFPFIESLTLKGLPSNFIPRDHYVIQITPWVEQLALEFRCLKELHIHGLVVHDEHLETLARKRGKDLRSLKIKMCKGFSSNGLMHVSKHCNQLRTLCLGYSDYNIVKDESWLYQLALNNTVLERLHVPYRHIYNAQDLTLLAKNCCNTLISLKIGPCYLSKLVDAFRYAVRLEHFGGYIFEKESELVGFRFPPNIHSLSRMMFHITQNPIVLPFLNQIRKLKLLSSSYRYECECLLFKRCPNLEVLHTKDVCGDRGLQIIGEFCKKLRKLTHNGAGFVTHVGLIALAKGCTKLECLKFTIGDIPNEALECLGTHFKNMRYFRIWLGKEDSETDLPLDNGVRAMLMGCEKLERLDINLRHEGLTDMGLEYIGKYGANLRSLSLTRTGKSDAGLVKLSRRCPKLRKLKLSGCPFSEQVVTDYVFNIPSLRYVWGNSSDGHVLNLIRPEFQS